MPNIQHVDAFAVKNVQRYGEQRATSATEHFVRGAYVKKRAQNPIHGALFMTARGKCQVAHIASLTYIAHIKSAHGINFSLKCHPELLLYILWSPFEDGS